MSEIDFWNIINSAKAFIPNDIDKQRDYIENILSKHAIKDIREFNNISETLISRARDKGIHEFLCDVFKDEISNNTFDFFMGWLILQGSALYNHTIKDPSFLKEVIEINFNTDLSILTCEGAIHMASSAYEIKTGRNYFEDF